MLQKHFSLLILWEVRINALTNTAAVFGALRELTNHTQGASPRGTSLVGHVQNQGLRRGAGVGRAPRGARCGCAVGLSWGHRPQPPGHSQHGHTGPAELPLGREAECLGWGPRGWHLPVPLCHRRAQVWPRAAPRVH